jgi:transposase-like protein
MLDEMEGSEIWSPFMRAVILQIATRLEEGATLSEIATELGMSEKLVKASLRKARQELEGKQRMSRPWPFLPTIDECAPSRVVERIVGAISCSRVERRALIEQLPIGTRVRAEVSLRLDRATSRAVITHGGEEKLVVELGWEISMAPEFEVLRDPRDPRDPRQRTERYLELVSN